MERIIAIAILVGDLQYEYTSEKGDYEDTFVHFGSENGIHVIHPGLDDSGCSEVDPVKEYGNNFLTSNFVSVIKDYTERFPELDNGAIANKIFSEVSLSR